jgi:hypothetical protein
MEPGPGFEPGFEPASGIRVQLDTGFDTKYSIGRFVVGVLLLILFLTFGSDHYSGSVNSVGYVLIIGAFLLLFAKPRTMKIVYIELTDSGILERNPTDSSERVILFSDITNYGARVVKTMTLRLELRAYIRLDLRSTGRQMRYYELPRDKKAFHAFEYALRTVIDRLNVDETAVTRPVEPESTEVSDWRPDQPTDETTEMDDEQPTNERIKLPTHPQLIDTSETDREFAARKLRNGYYMFFSILSALLGIGWLAAGGMTRQPDDWPFAMLCLFFAVVLWFARKKK